MHELRELLSKTLLALRVDAGVRSGVEACSANFGGEPVGFAEADGKGDEVLFYLLAGEL